MNSIDTKKADMLDELEDRWSPRSYDPNKSLGKEELAILLEAARWAPSSYNAQPWRYIYAFRGEPGFDKMIETLAASNQTWARDASILMLGVAKTSFEGREGENRFAFHDLGAANMALITQATSMGLHVRQMGGYSQQKAIELLGLDKDHQPASYLAVGYKDPELSTEIKKGRNRLSIEQFSQHFEG